MHEPVLGQDTGAMDLRGTFVSCFGLTTLFLDEVRGRHTSYV